MPMLKKKLQSTSCKRCYQTLLFLFYAPELTRQISIICTYSKILVPREEQSSFNCFLIDFFLAVYVNLQFTMLILFNVLLQNQLRICYCIK